MRCVGIVIPPLPEKNVVQKYQMTNEFIAQRQRALTIFLNRVVSLCSKKLCVKASCEIMCVHRAFDISIVPGHQAGDLSQKGGSDSCFLCWACSHWLGCLSMNLEVLTTSKGREFSGHHSRLHAAQEEDCNHDQLPHSISWACSPIRMENSSSQNHTHTIKRRDLSVAGASINLRRAL